MYKTLNHDNIAKFAHHFQDEDYLFMNLKFCDNGSLLDLLAIRKNLTTPEIQSFLYDLCLGIKCLHTNGIITVIFS